MNSDKAELPQEQNVGYSGLYLERSGIGAKLLAENLTRPPERPLDEAGKNEVRQFLSDMLAVPVGDGMTLESVLKTEVSGAAVAPIFFAEGIVAGEVQLEGIELPHFSSSDEVYTWLATSGLDKKQLMELSKKSVEVYKTHAAAALIADMPIDESITESRFIVLDPEDFTQSMRELQSARAMLQTWRKSAPRVTDSDEAKIAYSDIVLAKINAQLATGIPTVAYLHEQADLINDPELKLLADEALPQGFTQALQHDESRQRLFRRLDFLRNGIGYNKDGEATSVSAEVQADTAEAAVGGIFTLEQMWQMQEIMLTPEEMKSFIRNILSDAGLLSEEDESTYSPGRRKRANDGLFQVVINPGKATFAIDSISGVYKVSSEPRSLYDVVIVGGFHELEHVNQARANDAVDVIKGKRVSGLAEAGANTNQRQAEEKYFGYRKPYADTYAAALQSLEEGGSIGDAIKAFCTAKLRSMPDTNRLMAAKEAADRVVRLLTGGINSQPMAYAEESIIVHELAEASPEVQRRALAITGLDLVDQVRLHTFGLLDVPEGTSIDWSQYIMKELARYMPAADGEK